MLNYIVVRGPEVRLKCNIYLELHPYDVKDYETIIYKVLYDFDVYEYILLSHNLIASVLTMPSVQ